MPDYVIAIIFALIWIFVPVVSKLAGNKSDGKQNPKNTRKPLVNARPIFSEIFPEIKLENKAPQHEEGMIPVSAKPAKPAPAKPMAPAPILKEIENEEESFEEKMAAMSEEEKMIIYSEILKPRFDE